MKHWRGLGAVVLCVLGVFGAGLVATGRWRRAAIWFGATVVAVFAMMWTAWAVWLLIAVVVGSMVDSYVAAARAERCEWLSPACGVSLVATLAIAFGLRFFVVEQYRVPSSSMAPALAVGDRVSIEKLTPRWRSIARGEVIALRYPCDRDVDLVKRVIAIAGDTIEVRCETVYVNGERAARKLEEDAGTCRYEERSDQGEWSMRNCRRFREKLGDLVYDVLQAPAPLRRDFPDLALGLLRPPCQGVAWRGKFVDAPPAREHDACAPQRAFVVPAGEVFVLGDNRDNSSDSRNYGSVKLDDVFGRVVGIWYPLSRAGALD